MQLKKLPKEPVRFLPIPLCLLHHLPSRELPFTSGKHAPMPKRWRLASSQTWPELHNKARSFPPNDMHDHWADYLRLNDYQA